MSIVEEKASHAEALKKHTIYLKIFEVEIFMNFTDQHMAVKYFSHEISSS